MTRLTDEQIEKQWAEEWDGFVSFEEARVIVRWAEAAVLQLAGEPVAFVTHSGSHKYAQLLRDLPVGTDLYPGSPSREGEVVVTKNESGQIVAVTWQDCEGRILSVIAESAPAGDATQGDAGRWRR